MLGPGGVFLECESLLVGLCLISNLNSLHSVFDGRILKKDLTAGGIGLSEEIVPVEILIKNLDLIPRINTLWGIGLRLNISVICLALMFIVCIEK